MTDTRLPLYYHLLFAATHERYPPLAGSQQRGSNSEYVLREGSLQVRGGETFTGERGIFHGHAIFL